ncbi:hypothetical protein BDQ17DRAFT_1404667, partial [Cyathus striatus]
MQSPSKFPHIPEIIGLICEQLTSEEPTLASLARTSKMFEGPALDVLWADLVGFYPLVKCLPSNTWNEEEREDNKRCVVLKQHLTPADCSRFLYYARRVHRFTTDQIYLEVKVHTDISIYQALQFAVQGGKLLPNLRQLLWACEKETFPFLHMFLGPLLIKLMFRFSVSSKMQLSFVTALYKHYPSLKYVSLTFYPNASADDRKQAISLISSAVEKWNNLHSLQATSLTYPALLKIARLPHLGRLDISECKFDVVTPGTSCGGFPTLTTLLMNGCETISDCVAVLKIMDGSPVQSMRLGFKGVESSTSWKQVFLAINQHCHRETLTILGCRDGVNRRYYDTNIIRTPTRHEMISYETVKPLLVFHRFTSLMIETVKGFDFSDPTTIKEMATCWKNSQYLKFKQLPFSRADERPKIGLRDLVPFAEHCAELEELALAFDATFPPDADQRNILG